MKFKNIESASDNEQQRGRSTIMQKIEFGFSSSDEDRIPNTQNGRKGLNQQLEIIREDNREEEKGDGQIMHNNSDSFFAETTLRNRASTLFNHAGDGEEFLNVIAD